MIGSLTINTTRISFFIIILYINVTTSIKRGHFKAYISFQSKIIIKINTSGEQIQIFSSSIFKNPNSVKINNNEPIEEREIYDPNEEW